MKSFIAFLIITNGLIIFFFLQFIGYGVFSYFYYWKKRSKLHLSLKMLRNLSQQRGIDLPKIVLIIPARNESSIISSTIDNLVNIDYPKNKYQILFVLDDRELLNTDYEKTTHYYVYTKQKLYNQDFGREVLLSTSVPVNFDGKFPGKMLDTVVNSNKPRALNWALKFIPKNTQIIGFYDADSHPHPKTLLYVAYKYLTERKEPLLLQGPAVQIRNYFNLKALNKIYALMQAITHEWFLPILLFHLPFIGGTNFFIGTEFLYKINGFDQEALAEDLELGCRLYLEESIWPEFSPYISTEQTPPNFKSFFYQRVRWASGYIQVIKNMLTNEGYLVKRFFLFSMLIFYGILPWAAAQILAMTTLGMFLVSFLGITRISYLLPESLKVFSVLLNVFYLLFLVYYFTYALKKLYIPAKSFNVNLSISKQYFALLIFPIAVTLGLLPYSYGFVLSLIGNEPSSWIKTPRSKE